MDSFQVSHEFLAGIIKLSIELDELKVLTVSV